jgi:hypothetical protein
MLHACAVMFWLQEKNSTKNEFSVLKENLFFVEFFLCSACSGEI